MQNKCLGLKEVRNKQPTCGQSVNLLYCVSDDIQLWLEPTSIMSSHVKSCDHNGILEQKSKKMINHNIYGSLHKKTLINKVQ